jgi:hypothetical protein
LENASENHVNFNLYSGKYKILIEPKSTDKNDYPLHGSFKFLNVDQTGTVPSKFYLDSMNKVKEIEIEQTIMDLEKKFKLLIYFYRSNKEKDVNYKEKKIDIEVTIENVDKIEVEQELEMKNDVARFEKPYSEVKYLLKKVKKWNVRSKVNYCRRRFYL